MGNPLKLEKFEVDLGSIKLQIPRNVGPRILSLTYKGGENLFAVLRDENLKSPGQSPWYFFGGHRLWIAPEKPEITYIPDNEPIEVIQNQNSIELIQKPTREIGIQKKLQIKKTDFHDNLIIVDHHLHNFGDEIFECAPWAITQFRIGGIALIPLRNQKNNFYTDLLPDRSIILWPYTDIQDRRLFWKNEYLEIDSQFIDEKPIKIGTNNMQAWIAYLIDKQIFIKYSKSDIFQNVIDHGATSEIYCNDKFIELETIGSFKKINPGSALYHREVWRLAEYPHDSFSFDRINEYFENNSEHEACIKYLHSEEMI